MLSRDRYPIAGRGVATRSSEIRVNATILGPSTGLCHTPFHGFRAVAEASRGPLHASGPPACGIATLGPAAGPCIGETVTAVARKCKILRRLGIARRPALLFTARC